MIISFGRKNAKTTMSAFLLLLHLCGPEARFNSQLYSAAQSRDQAAILFALAAKMVRMSPDLSAIVGVRDNAKQLYCDELGTLYRALSAEASTAYGLSPVFAVHDELGQCVGPTSRLYDAIETAAAAHDEPLSIIISTQAPTDADLLSILIDDALAGHDPETKVSLYSAPEGIDPFSVKALRAANPAYGDFLSSKELKSQAASAKRMPSKENSYRNLVLNQRIARDAPFVSQAVWRANSADPRKEDFKSMSVIGLDLSRRIDLTAMVMVGAGDDDQVSVHCEFFAPKDGVRDRSIADRVPYDMWADKGFLTLTPGKTVGYDFVADKLVSLCEEFGVQEIRFDRWGIPELKTQLALLDAGDLPLEPHGQGFKDMAPALNTLEALLINGEIRHGSHPILTWCAANAVVDSDPAGNRKLNKKKATGRIDGMVALAMGVAGLSVLQDSGSLDEFLNNMVVV